MSLDNALLLAYVLTELAVIGLLLYRRIWRLLPVFCVYCVWDLFSNVGVYAIQRFSPNSYVTTYMAETAVDSALQFGILVELAWSVLRPLRAFLSRRALVVVGAVILAVGAMIWPFVTTPGLGRLPTEKHVIVHLQQTVSILRILFFLALAGCSQLLSIGWRDRELQVASGFGFYSLVGIVVAMLNSSPTMGPYYGLLNSVVITSYICSLLYWAFSFSQQEAERREFTPQMQTFLLAVAGAAKSARIDLVDSAEIAKKRKPEK
jgi:hypothetical protein